MVADMSSAPRCGRSRRAELQRGRGCGVLRLLSGCCGVLRLRVLLLAVLLLVRRLLIGLLARPALTLAPADVVGHCGGGARDHCGAGHPAQQTWHVDLLEVS